MNENEENEALAALLTVARGIYDSGERFGLPVNVVVAVARGIVASRPDVTPDELVRIAGTRGIPKSVLVRCGRGEPAPIPIPRPASAWARRTRLGARW